ncbi:hypothetical protein AMTRI_Chr12g270960 [Amborella trichopoda]
MYAMSYTRADIAFVVGKLNRYINNPSQEHWIVVNRVLRYLKGTIDYGLYYVGEPTILEGYNNSNWIMDSEESKSTSRWIFTYGRGIVVCGSKKQIYIPKSTMESELITLKVEAEWLRNWLVDVPLISRPMLTLSIWCDCEAAIY